MSKGYMLRREDVISEAALNASKTIVAEDGDYIGKDGLLYCGKCHTRKQKKALFMGEKITVMCLCKCKAEKRDSDAEEQKKKDRMLEIQTMRSVGFHDSEMRKWTFDVDDMANKKVSTIARNYVKNFDEMCKRNRGLLFYGGVGTGKTFMAACIANALIDKGVPCLVTNFARLTSTISGMHEGRQEYIDSLRNYKLLVIDDLGAERDTEYMGEMVQNIIDERYRSQLPVIVTANLTADELKYPDDIRKQRIYSRLFDMCFLVEVESSDRRKTKFVEEHDEIASLLGL